MRILIAGLVALALGLGAASGNEGERYRGNVKIDYRKETRKDKDFYRHHRLEREARDRKERERHYRRYRKEYRYDLYGRHKRRYLRDRLYYCDSFPSTYKRSSLLF